MAEFTSSGAFCRATPRATLAALGVKLTALDLLAPLRTGVSVPQKRVTYTPFDKLYDCFIGMLAGAHCLADTNRVLRADPALQAAFGRTGCAEQSTIQDTLDACTPQTVAQMETAYVTIFQRFSQAARHDYAAAFQILDADLTGNPCGAKAEFATPGYFATPKTRQGRQVGRVLASRYGEVVVDRLYAGNTGLVTALPSLIQAAAATLGLTAEQRARTVVRVDAGGGSVDDVNALLQSGYGVLGKDYSAVRARKQAKRVTRFFADPKVRGREVGWVPGEAPEYVQPVQRIAVRCRKKNGQWGIGMLIVSETAAQWAGSQGASTEASALFAVVEAYDRRGGACETSFKEDRQGLGMTKRNKRKLLAQQMLVQLGALAHNVIVWSKRWLQPVAERVSCKLLGQLGIERLVRDVFGVMGAVETDETGQVQRILLNAADRWAHRLLQAFQGLVSEARVAVVLSPLEVRSPVPIRAHPRPISGET